MSDQTEKQTDSLHALDSAAHTESASRLPVVALDLPCATRLTSRLPSIGGAFGLPRRFL